MTGRSVARAGELDQEALVAAWIAVARRHIGAAHGDPGAAAEAIAAERALHERTDAALAQGAVLPSAWPRRRLGLSDTEERALWVLIAHELCPEARGRLRALGTEDLPDVSLDVLRRVVHAGRIDLRSWRELAPGGTLRRACLVNHIGAADAPAHRTMFRVARRVLALAHGDTDVDEELDGIAARATDARSLDEIEADPAARDRVRACFAAAPGLAILHGRPGSGRRSLWLAAAREARRGILVVDARELPASHDQAARQLRVVAREARLLVLAPLILHLDALAGSADAQDRIELVEEELGDFVLATADRPVVRHWQRPVTSIELPPLGEEARARVWQRALPAMSAEDAARLTARYPLAPALIRTAGAIAAREAGEAEVEPRHIEAGVRAVLEDQRPAARCVQRRRGRRYSQSAPAS